MMTSPRPPLAQRATELLAAERPPPAPTAEDRVRTIAVLARTIALEARARRRRRVVAFTTLAAAAALVLFAGAALVRSPVAAGGGAPDRRCGQWVLTQGGAQLYELGRVAAERGHP